jgi:hypothetical protein
MKPRAEGNVKQSDDNLRGLSVQEVLAGYEARAAKFV